MGLRLGMMGHGRFGSALGALAREAGMEVRAYDPREAVPPESRAASPEDLARSADFIVLAVPVVRTPDALATLRPFLREDHLVLDVGSVKLFPIAAMSEILGSAVPWVGSHPLFGPTSIALGERPLSVVVCPNPLHPAGAGRVRSLYEKMGCRVVEMDPDRHDRLMARTHALAFFVAKGMIDAGVPENPPVAPPSFQAIARTLEAVRSDATHLFTSLHARNPYAAEARRLLLNSLTEADRNLGALESGDAEESAGAQGLAIPDLGAHSPALRETRDLIDEVDRELVALLARRSQLARRAAKAKAELGRGIRDPRREADLLSARRAWAEELGLDSESVEEIFRAVVRFSLAAQQPKGD
jgi:prephenate dehydrogenase